MATTYDSNQPPPEHWDDEVATSLIGKTVLVGLTYCGPDDQVLHREQFHGFVRSADRRAGIGLELDGDRIGERYTLPPMTQVFQRASLGEYRLSGTGEVVHDPDFLATYTIYRSETAS
ncbi:hypothetical protein [Phenylobacterium sp.]|uniref:hypothetical protein n=1 Tax=Phenylobacterium sp. TaxID=1871053 RepID=UPI00301D6786